MTRTFTAEELEKFTGENEGPIYISVKCKVHDCSPGRNFYGPGGPYAVLAGKEASRSLGKMLINDAEANAGWENLSEEHLQTLDEWAAKFDSKYPVVGQFSPDAEFTARGQLFAP